MKHSSSTKTPLEIMGWNLPFCSG